MDPHSDLNWSPQSPYLDRTDAADLARLQAVATETTIGFLERFYGRIRPNPKPHVVRRIGMADIVRYFVEQHPGTPDIASGALLRRPHPRGHLLFQVFLDDKGKICVDWEGKPYGQRLVAKDLDPDLAARFANGTDTLIFS